MDKRYIPAVLSGLTSCLWSVSGHANGKPMYFLLAGLFLVRAVFCWKKVR